MKILFYSIVLSFTSLIPILGCARYYYDELHARGFYPTGMKYEGRLDYMAPGERVAYLS